jgi:hypothetical protein
LTSTLTLAEPDTIQLVIDGAPPISPADPVDEFEVGIELASEHGLQALQRDADGDVVERRAPLEGESTEVRCEDLVAAAVTKASRPETRWWRGLLHIGSCAQ